MFSSSCLLSFWMSFWIIQITSLNHLLLSNLRFITIMGLILQALAILLLSHSLNRLFYLSIRAIITFFDNCLVFSTVCSNDWVKMIIIHHSIDFTNENLYFNHKFRIINLNTYHLKDHCIFITQPFINVILFFRY